MLVIAAAMTPFTSSGVGPRAAGLPTYELMGFPISPHQFSVVGSTHVEQPSPVPTLTLFGTPASPHQIAVLMPRRETAGITATRVTNAELPAPEPELSNMAILCSSACLRLPHRANPGLTIRRAYRSALLRSHGARAVK